MSFGLLLAGFTIPVLAQSLATDGGVSIQSDGPGAVAERPVDSIPSE